MQAIMENLPMLDMLLDDRVETGELPHFGSWVLSKDNGQDYVIGFKSGSEGLLIHSITPIKIYFKNYHRGGYDKIGEREEVDLFLSRENLDKWTNSGKDGYSLHCQC
jgi:hypothetical protein